MASIIRKTIHIQPLRLAVRAMSGGQAGDGAAGGSIKEKKKDGTKKIEGAQEDQYFRKLQAEQLKALKSFKKDIDSEVKHHEDSIKHMEGSIEFHKQRVAKLKDAKKSGHDSD